MIVQNQTNRGFRRVIGVQILEQSDELNAPMALLDAGGNVSIQQIQSRQNGPRSSRSYS